MTLPEFSGKGVPFGRVLVHTRNLPQRGTLLSCVAFWEVEIADCRSHGQAYVGHSPLFVSQEFVLAEARFDVAAAITPGAGFFHDPCRQAGG